MANDTAVFKAKQAILAADSESKLKRYAIAVHKKQDDGFYTAEQAAELISLLDERMDGIRSGKS
jgi:hypothetical protein